ncbi:BREX-1 system adenine-specific DNA-methyltransferase PglX [Pumilibacter muris]|uniref:BREX-1 system adenine-specific DNA-methyltransferase PglX n=1 Tax=Pumilibacter muris TaxID=2941510 RepID=UPI002040587C|nr:BREX-1 system adenine-specific DNA-methyltransferase PglX [Pumilibacter muris]
MALRNAFVDGIQLREIGAPRVGLQTSDNNRFLRLWHEVSVTDSNFSATDCINAFASGKKWYPHNKGGIYRKWYGNLDYVINYQNNGQLLSETEGAAVIPDRLVFQEAITYSRLCSGNISFRLQPNGCTFDSASVNAFVDEYQQKYVLAFLNTNVAGTMVKIISPTINTQPGDIAKLPILFSAERKEIVDNLSVENISITKQDWIAFETSWDFKKHPLI